jgi:hypothetical protein
VSLSASGVNLLVGMTSHWTDNRDYLFSLAVIPGIYVPYATTREPEDGPGAFVPQGGIVPQGLTQAEIDAIATAVLARVQAQFDRVVNNLQPKVEGLFNGGQGSLIVYDQLKNTSYTGALGALQEAGLYHPPAPHP